MNGSIPQLVAALLAAVIGGTLATDFATTVGVILTAVGLLGVVFTLAAGRQPSGRTASTIAYDAAMWGTLLGGVILVLDQLVGA